MTASNDDILWRLTAGESLDAERLGADVTADAVVVGGGFTGLSAALHLAEANAKVRVLEAETVGFGGSGRNVGLVNAGLWTPPDGVEDALGVIAGTRLNEILAGGPDCVFSLIEKHGIECDAVRNGTLHCAHSPAGLAAWIGEKLQVWADTGMPGNPGLSPQWMISTAALYWFTGTAGTAHMLYREAVNDPLAERFVTVPTAVAHFARELVIAPRTWAERHYNIVRWTRYVRGGHFAAVEVPDLFVGDVRSFARALCGSGEAG